MKNTQIMTNAKAAKVATLQYLARTGAPSLYIGDVKASMEEDIIFLQDECDKRKRADRRKRTVSAKARKNRNESIRRARKSSRKEERAFWEHGQKYGHAYEFDRVLLWAPKEHMDEYRNRRQDYPVPAEA